MLINKDVAVTTNSILLVPYSEQHVLTYHERMKDEEIRQVTASEPLSLKEEHEMQRSWCEDADKLTFIKCLPVSVETVQVIAGTDDAPVRLLGDVNLFLTSNNNNSDGNGDSYTSFGEIELMIATKGKQGRGYGRAMLLAFMEYILTHQKDILEEYDQGRLHSLNVHSRLAYLRARIAESNERSIRLFESAWSSRVSTEADYFGEVELRLVASLSETLTSLGDKYCNPAYQEVHYEHEVVEVQ